MTESQWSCLARSMLCQCFTRQFFQKSLRFTCCQECVPSRVISFNLWNIFFLDSLRAQNLRLQEASEIYQLLRFRGWQDAHDLNQCSFVALASGRNCIHHFTSGTILIKLQRPAHALQRRGHPRLVRAVCQGTISGTRQQSLHRAGFQRVLKLGRVSRERPMLRLPCLVHAPLHRGFPTVPCSPILCHQPMRPT